MKRYDDILLHELLNRYERSLLYAGTNLRTVNISVTISRKLIPEYFDETFSGYEMVHEQLEAMEEKGYLTLVWKNGKKGHILEKVILNPDKAEEIYVLLGRKSRKEKENRILEIAEGIRDKLPEFYTWISERIRDGKSIRQYVDPDESARFIRVCRVITGILENDQPVFLRTFSIRLFQDSKIAEKEIGLAVRLISTFHPEERLRDLETDELLEEFEIYRNPSWIMLKGNVGFRMMDIQSLMRRKSQLSFGECFTRLGDFSGGIGITQEDAGKICWDRKEIPARVITIENLTSFHQWEPGEDLVIYLGGYANRAKRSFLKEIRKAYPRTEFCHFGDIDCGGFRIWKNLCRETGIDIIPLYMDEETYRRNLKSGKPCTENDIKTLNKMKEDPFFQNQKELFALMIEKKTKIEQESVCLK